jgi:mRNA interferase RelE/StbE
LAWTVEYLPRAVKVLKKLDKQTASAIWKELRSLEETKDPRSRGEALTGQLRGLWRYRVGDYRIICEIQDERVVVLVIDIGHRSTVYRSH